VEFDIEGASEPEAKGTVLFESPNATLWLSDPVSGNMAFSREDHLYTFRQNLLPGEKLHVKITGTNKTTTLWVNGKLVDDMNVRWVSYNGGRNKMAEVRTLVFPLQKAGNFNATVTNLKVINSVE
jgi:hexosaminidase